MSVRVRMLAFAVVVAVVTVPAAVVSGRAVAGWFGRHLVDASTVQVVPVGPVTVREGPVRLYAEGVAASAVTVTAPDGRDLPVRSLSGRGAWIGSRNVVWSPVARFDAPVHGTYTLTVDAPAGTEVCVVDSSPPGPYTTARWFGQLTMWGVGVLGGFLALVVAVIGLVLGRRRPAPSWPPMPPGAQARQWPPPASDRSQPPNR